MNDSGLNCAAPLPCRLFHTGDYTVRGQLDLQTHNLRLEGPTVELHSGFQTPEVGCGRLTPKLFKGQLPLTCDITLVSEEQHADSMFLFVMEWSPQSAVSIRHITQLRCFSSEESFVRSVPLTAPVRVAVVSAVVAVLGFAFHNYGLEPLTPHPVGPPPAPSAHTAGATSV